MGVINRLQHAWNAFLGRDPTPYISRGGYGGGSRPDRVRLKRENQRSILASFMTRIAVDVSQISIKHVKLDENDRFLKPMNSGLNNCLTLNANRDQTSRAFIKDVVMSMMDEGVVAIVITKADFNPETTAFDILELKVGKILEWFPEHIRVRVYNEDKCEFEEIVVPKSITAIIENPLYSVMNEYNSTLQRLIRKLDLLDTIDEQSASNKLDLIIQVPYSARTELQQARAKQRRDDLKTQLADSEYGVAYIDGTEHVIQLNRAIENKMLSQVEYFTNLVFSQIGFSQAILDGTANEDQKLEYQNRILEPFISTICDSMRWKFLSKTARTQGQSIIFFREPFKLVPTSQLADLADKLTRNEIMSSNEFRQILGLIPSKDPSADELRNKNINQSATAEAQKQPPTEERKEPVEKQ